MRITAERDRINKCKTALEKSARLYYSAIAELLMKKLPKTRIICFVADYMKAVIESGECFNEDHMKNVVNKLKKEEISKEETE